MTQALESNIVGVQVYEYAIPFKTPFQTGKKKLKTRKGLVIVLKEKDGLTGYGETAPLDGFSVETLQQARGQVYLLAKKLENISLFGELAGTPGFFSKAARGDSIFPSVSFGIESAIVNLMQERMKKVFDGSPVPGTGRKIRVNALLSPDVTKDSLEKAVLEIIDSGFKTIKIKVGRESLETDIERIVQVGHILSLHRGISIRLDANRLWDFQTAIEFAKGIRSVHECIEYIEEPFDVQSLDQFSRFYVETGIPTALDESLKFISDKDIQIPGGVAAFILKPTLLGGIDRYMLFSGLAKKNHIKPVISSCFECGPGFIELCKMALMNNADDIAYGLDTLKYLKTDLFLNPISIENGSIPVDGLLSKLHNYDFKKMKQVYGWPRE